MDQDSPSAVSEALPGAPLYLVPQAATPCPGPSLRDKILRHGAQALSNTDLLTVILGSGCRRSAEQLVRRFGLAELAGRTLGNLITSKSLRKGTAARLAGTLELCRRIRSLERDDCPRITRPSEVAAQVRDLRHARKEHLVGLYLDAQNGLIHRETITVGSLNTTRTHPREILLAAIEHSALGFILVHNHPSGCLDPSEEDVEFTHSVRRAGEVVGIELYDHVIVASGGYASLRERGLL